MFTLHHAIKIAAPRDKVYQALTNVSEFAKWHYAGVEGEIAVGATLRMNAKPHMSFVWKTLELVENTRLVQQGVEGPGEPGKRIAFELSDIDGGTLVGFTDGVDYSIERAGGLKSMMFGGEGLFLATLSGHGTVWLQSLPFSRLADRILALAPSAGGANMGEE